MKTNTQSPPKHRKTVQFVIADQNGEWFALAEKAISDNVHLLDPDEKTPQNLVRMILKNADKCIKVIKSSK